MPSRTLLFVGLLAAAVGGPYLLTRQKADPVTRPVSRDGQPQTPESPSLLARIGRWMRSPPGGTESERPHQDPFASLPEFGSVGERAAEQWAAGRPLQPAERTGPPGVPVTELLRFDISPDWVRDQWTEIGGQYPDAGLLAIRVPIVTGTAPEDIAGSLTYFFDRQHRVQRIRLHGYTGDVRVLSQFVQERFGLKPYASIEPLLLLAFRAKRPVGVMRVQLSSSRAARATTAKYLVDLELNAPGKESQLSETMLQTLHEMRKSSVF